MHKILFFLLLSFIILSLNITVVQAKFVNGCDLKSTITTPALSISNITQNVSDGVLQVDCPDTAVCFKLKEIRLTGTVDYYCYDAAAAAAATTGETCKDPATGKSNCASAKAVPCPDGLPGIMTAIGCVPTEPKALVEGLLKYGTLAAGGIAFIIMILAAFQMITAEGNPEAIKEAQEKFYSAIIGLLLIIFSVLLMQVIGVDVLGLPGFGK